MDFMTGDAGKVVPPVSGLEEARYVGLIAVTGHALTIGPFRGMCLEADALVLTSRIHVGAPGTMARLTLLPCMRVVRKVSRDVMTAQTGLVPDFGGWFFGRLLLAGLRSGCLRLLGGLILSDSTGEKQ